MDRQCRCVVNSVINQNFIQTLSSLWNWCHGVPQGAVCGCDRDSLLSHLAFYKCFLKSSGLLRQIHGYWANSKTLLSPVVCSDFSKPAAGHKRFPCLYSLYEQQWDGFVAAWRNSIWAWRQMRSSWRRWWRCFVWSGNQALHQCWSRNFNSI